MTVSPKELAQNQEQIFDAVFAQVGEQANALDGEPFDEWYDRMTATGLVHEQPDLMTLRPDERLRALADEEAALERGAVLVEDSPVEDDLRQAASDIIRAKPIGERFAIYKAQRAALLKED